jgi:hypothetical protein
MVLARARQPPATVAWQAIGHGEISVKDVKLSLERHDDQWVLTR